MGLFKGLANNGLCPGQSNGLKCLSSPARSPSRANTEPASFRAVPGSCRAKKTCFMSCFLDIYNLYCHIRAGTAANERSIDPRAASFLSVVQSVQTTTTAGAV
jgi:hypothetical protein